MAEKFTNYESALDFLYAQLPMYQKIGGKAFKPGLDNIKKLLKALGNPEASFPCVHIAGTNGKGSTSHMIAAVLQASGLKVGLYTSPHYVDFRERAKINGQLISKQEVLDFVNLHYELMQAIQPSYFELTVALAFFHFEQHAVDVAVIETGLGGLLDSTNVVDPLLSVITNIDYDHQDVLGETLAEIAAQKAGIIKPAKPVVIGMTHSKTKPVFLAKAEKEKALIYFADELLEVELLGAFGGQMQVQVKAQNTVLFPDLLLDAAGTYQLKNLRTAVQALLLLRSHFELADRAFYEGFAKLKELTYFIGRWQLLTTKPLTITDSGHNVDGIRQALAQLQHYTYQKLHLVIGFSTGKDHSEILKLFPRDAQYYWTQPSVPRALGVRELLTLSEKAGLTGSVFSDVGSALKAAWESAAPEDLIFIGGSSFIVADVLALPTHLFT